MNNLINKIAKIFKDEGQTFVVKNADGEPDTKAEILVRGDINYIPKVSVIIPVYNVERYLRECLDSIINQTLKEIEIICVDDGSTDSSLKILKEYAVRDNRITIVIQDNLHAGVARNAGLAIAKGEYLSFLDSDDFFEPNMLEETYKNAVQNNSDIVMFNLYLYDDTTKENKEAEWTLNIKDAPAVFNYKDIPDRIFKLSNCWVWNRLYNHQFVKNNNLHFQNLGCANDTYFSCIATVAAQKITYINSRFVHYRTNRQQFQNVTSVSFRHKYPTDLLKCFYTVYKKLEEMKVYDIVKYSYLMVAAEHICWSEQAFLSDDDLHKKFTTYFADNYNDVFKEKSPFKNNTLNRKYTKLRNILIDAGVFQEIPKRIFYVWGANEPIRPEVQKCIDTWEKYLPDYDIVQINDESTRYFNFKKELEQNKWFRTVYERKMWAYVADYIRVKTLYNNGGIYFDTDVSVVQNMNKFLHEPAFVGIQTSSLDGSGDWVEPAICGAQKNNKFFGQVVSFYDELIWKEPIFTMPHLFNYYLRKHDIFPFPKKSEQKIIKLPDITIYPERYFIPYRWNTEFKPECIESDTHTIHHWSGSWTKPEILHFLKHKHVLSEQELNLKVSVIVPVYNVEQYLRECLDSVCNQTLKEIEIICVNDGSTDGSLNILNEYAKKDSRIKVISQNNQGLGAARNTGVREAKAPFLFFIDSDDWIDRNCLNLLYTKISSTKSELCLYGLQKYDDSTKTLLEQDSYFDTSCYDIANSDVFSYEQIKPAIFRRFGAVLKMYSTDFFVDNNLFFPIGVCFEDVFIHCKSLMLAKHITVCNENLYFYRINRTDSIMQSTKNNTKIFDVFKYFESVLNLIRSKKIYDNISYDFLKFILEQTAFHSRRIDKDFKQEFLNTAKDFIVSNGLVQDINKWADLQSEYNKIFGISVSVFVSIIVPVYNVEHYLRECLDSLLNQTLRDIEIICVNDCSTDGSLQILREYADKDERVKILDNTTNQKQGASRNRALEIAQGKYVQFVDADDYLKLDAVEKLYTYANKNNLDMLMFSGENFEDGTKELKSNAYWNFTFLPSDWNQTVFSYKDCLIYMHLMAVSACLTIYKRAFIESIKLRFPEKLFFEDNVFFIKGFTQASACGILKEKLYCRRLHPSSTTRNWNKYYMDYLEIVDIVLDYLKNIKINETVFKNYIDVYCNNIRQNFKSLPTDKAEEYKKPTRNLFKKYGFINNKPYWFFPWYLFKVKIKTKEYNELLSQQIINDIRKYRIDIRYIDKAGDMDITGNAQITTPGWIKGCGHVVSDIKPIIHFDITTHCDGKLALYFRGQDYRKNGKREPVYIVYKSIKIDGKDIISKPFLAWHDNPFGYELDVKNNQNISVDVEMADYEYSDHEFFSISRLVHPELSIKKSDFIKCARKILKMSEIHCEKIQQLPVIESDVFIPLGTACRPAYWLKKAGLRKYTLPFDWMMNYDLGLVIDTLKDRKKDWFLNFTETPTTNELHRNVKDNASSMISLHHFPKEYPVPEYLPMFNVIFNRRKERFYNVIKNNNTVCFVANRKTGIVDILRFMKSMKDMYKNRKFIFIQIKHTVLDSDIIKYELDENCVLYDIHCNDINEKDPKDWIGNVDLWTGLISNLKLNPKAKDVQDKEICLDMQMKEISAYLNLLDYKQKESINKLNRDVSDTKQRIDTVISEQKSMKNNLEKNIDGLNNQIIEQKKIFDAGLSETNNKITEIKNDFIDNVNDMTNNLVSNIDVLSYKVGLGMNAIADNITHNIGALNEKVELNNENQDNIASKLDVAKVELNQTIELVSDKIVSDLDKKYSQLSNNIQNTSNVSIKNINDLNKNINNIVNTHNNSMRSFVSKNTDKMVSDFDKKYSQLSNNIRNSLTLNSNEIKELNKNLNRTVNDSHNNLQALISKNNDKIVSSLDTKYNELNQNIELVSDKVVSEFGVKHEQLSDSIKNFVDKNADSVAEVKKQIQEINQSISVSEENVKESVHEAQDNLQSLISKNNDKIVSSLDTKYEKITSDLNNKHNDLKQSMQSGASKCASDLDNLYKRTTDIINKNSDSVAETYTKLHESIKQNEKMYDNLLQNISDIASQQNVNNDAVVGVQNRIGDLEINTKTLFKQNSEPYWANVYHDTTINSQWLQNKSVSPGRWAVSYIVLYVLYRVLDEIKPRSVLECGLGQSSKLTIQYADSHNADLMICENNPEWLSFFQRQFPTADKYTKILDTKMVHIVPEHESRTYAEFKSAIENKKFNLVLIDGPLGSKHYSRPEILDVVDNLDKSFIIMLDDMNRMGEQEIWELLKQKLKDKGIEFVDTVYASDKSVGLLCSPDLSYLTTL